MIWYKNVGRSFFGVVTIHACDRQTDRRTDEHTSRSWLYVRCIMYSRAVIKPNIEIS